LPKSFLHHNKHIGHYSKFNRCIYEAFLNIPFAIVFYRILFHIYNMSYIWLRTKQFLKQTSFGKFIIPLKRKIYSGKYSQEITT